VNLVVHLLHSYKVTNHPRLINSFIILHFPNLLITGLLICQEKLGSSVTQIRILVENLRFRPGYGVLPLCIVYCVKTMLPTFDFYIRLAMSSMDNEGLKLANPRKKLEDDYLDIESKVFFFSMLIYIIMCQTVVPDFVVLYKCLFLILLASF